MEFETGDGEIRCVGPGKRAEARFRPPLDASVPRLFDHL